MRNSTTPYQSRCKNTFVLIVVVVVWIHRTHGPRKPASLLQSSPLSLTALCSTSGNRRNEEHYSGGWKTPLITSRRAVRYPLDLPPGRWCAVRPNCLLTSWAKIGAITPGPGRCFSSCTSFVVSHWRESGKGRKRDWREGEERRTTQGRERSTEGDFRTMGMDIGVLERDSRGVEISR